MIKKLLLLLVAGSFTLFISCESEDAEDVNQQRIETTYYLSYDQGLNETVARAEFTFGSTYLKFNSPSGVFFDNDELREQELLGIVGYSRKYTGFISSGTFSYTNQDESTYTNTVALVSAISLPDEVVSISVSEGATISWEGEPVGQGETVSLILSAGSSTYTFSVDGVNADKIVIPGDHLTEEAIGEAQVTIKRSGKSTLAETPEEGGYAYTTYTSLKMAAEVVQ